MKDPQQSRKFFDNVRAFKDRKRPELWDVRSLWPDKSDNEITNTLAGFFNKISCEFKPLDAVPITYDRQLLVLDRMLAWARCDSAPLLMRKQVTLSCLK